MIGFSEHKQMKQATIETTEIVKQDEMNKM